MRTPAGLQNLSALADVAQIPVADRIALSDASLRRWVAIAIVMAFLVVNGAVLFGVWSVFMTDVELLVRQTGGFTAKDRLVTTELLMTLIGATTVQLGALIVLIGKYLFPAPKP